MIDEVFFGGAKDEEEVIANRTSLKALRALSTISVQEQVLFNFIGFFLKD